MFCSNCGKEIPNDAKFCQYCGKEVIEQSLSDEIVEELNKIRYCPNCKKQTPKSSSICEHCGYDINKPLHDFKASDALGCLFLIVVISFFIIGGCNNKETSQSKEQYTPEQKQQLMNATNQFVAGSQQNGLIKKITKDCYDDGECLYIMQIDEYVWNTIPHDTKSEIKDWLWQYGKLRGRGTVLRSYYSGKGL